MTHHIVNIVLSAHAVHAAAGADKLSQLLIRSVRIVDARVLAQAPPDVAVDVA